MNNQIINIFPYKFSVFRSNGNKNECLFVLLHGAGHTALSWCLVAVQYTKNG